MSVRSLQRAAEVALAFLLLGLTRFLPATLWAPESQAGLPARSFLLPVSLPGWLGGGRARMAAVRGLRASLRVAEPEPMEVEEGELQFQQQAAAAAAAAKVGVAAAITQQEVQQQEEELPVRRSLRELLPVMQPGGGLEGGGWGSPPWAEEGHPPAGSRRREESALLARAPG